MLIQGTLEAGIALKSIQVLLRNFALTDILSAML